MSYIWCFSVSSLTERVEIAGFTWAGFQLTAEEAVQNLLDSTYLLCYNREKMQMRHPFYVDIQYALKDFWTS